MKSDCGGLGCANRARKKERKLDADFGGSNVAPLFVKPSPLTFVPNEEVFHAEVLVLGVVRDGGLPVPLGPQNFGFPLEFNIQALYFTVFGDFQRDLPRDAVPICESVAVIDWVVGNFQTLDRARHEGCVAHFCRQTSDKPVFRLGCVIHVCFPPG